MLERFIVVATDKLQRGVFYLGDLRPDASKRNSSVDPPAQTRYLTPPDNDLVSVDAASGTLMHTARGVAAYLAARVAPGGVAPLSGSVKVQGVATADTLTIGTTVLTAGTTEDPATATFLDSATAGSDSASAASLANVLQSAQLQAALKTDLGAVLTSSVAGAVVSMSLPKGTKVPTVATSAAARLVISAFTTAPAALPGPYAYDQAAAAVLARVRSFSSMTLGDVNSILGHYLGGELTAAGGSASAGDLTEFLSLLAGRTFELLGSTQLFSGTSWVGSGATGSFTRPRKIYDAHMVQGMLVPLVPGGDSAPLAIGPARRTFPGSSFNSSAVNGQLARLASGVAVRGSDVPERVIVIYTEDGSLA